MSPATTTYGNRYNTLKVNTLIVKKRFELGITQREMADSLAKATGKRLHQSDLSRIERHVSVIDEDMAEGVAKVLDVPVEEVKEMIRSDVRARDKWRKRIRAEVGAKTVGTPKDLIAKVTKTPLEARRRGHECSWSVVKVGGGEATLLCLDCLQAKTIPVLTHPRSE